MSSSCGANITPYQRWFLPEDRLPEKEVCSVSSTLSYTESPSDVESLQRSSPSDLKCTNTTSTRCVVIITEMTVICDSPTPCFSTSFCSSSLSCLSNAPLLSPPLRQSRYLHTKTFTDTQTFTVCVLVSCPGSPVSAAAVGASGNLQPHLPPALLSMTRHGLQQQLKYRHRHILLKRSG